MYYGEGRKSLRLKDYNYSGNGVYFVTFCTYKNQCYFGEINDGKMFLNDYGKIVEKKILETKNMRKEIEIDNYIIMPNHVHMIIIIKTNDFNDKYKKIQKGQEKTKNFLSNTIQAIKASITKEMRDVYQNFEFAWQKSFYDVIICNKEQLEKSREYIKNNPFKWYLDINNPNNFERINELKKQGKR